jgi:uncharacterized protein with ATP-grasp and redox domains
MIEKELPVPYRGNEIGKWVHYSIVKRLPAIIERVINENDFDQKVEEQLKSIKDDIPFGLIRSFRDCRNSGDVDWDNYVSMYKGMNWLDIPWFFAELYFYRRILEATRYFSHDENERIDPYQFQKNQGLIAARPQIINLIEQMDIWKAHPKCDFDILEYIFKLALWGNRADLSLWPVNNDETSGSFSFLQFDRQIILDESKETVDYIKSNPQNFQRVDIVLDNVGLELVSDLNLADYLLTEGIADQICLHVKKYPIFVSDAMVKDIMHTTETLSKDSNDLVSALGDRLREYFIKDSLILRDHPFWVSPLPMWEVPKNLADDLKDTQLIIVKGDANYRRILGDLHWSRQSLFTSIVKYLPTSLVALRVLKSEIIVGIQKDHVLELQKKDPDWMQNGRWGVIQFAGKEKELSENNFL